MTSPYSALVVRPANGTVHADRMEILRKATGGFPGFISLLTKYHQEKLQPMTLLKVG